MTVYSFCTLLSNALKVVVLVAFIQILPGLEKWCKEQKIKFYFKEIRWVCFVFFFSVLSLSSVPLKHFCFDSIDLHFVALFVCDFRMYNLSREVKYQKNG